MKTLANSMPCAWSLNQGVLIPRGVDCSKCDGYEANCECYTPVPYVLQSEKGGKS